MIHPSLPKTDNGKLDKLALLELTTGAAPVAAR
jgi:hypothetical protein